MESSPGATALQNAIGTSISGNAQVINAGRDVVLHGPPPAGLYDLLRPVNNATHIRSGPVARCNTGTRLNVITAIEWWIESLDKRAVCWLNGPAGYGKSALAQTIAERYAAMGRLLGSFFFLRGAGERSHISCLIPTLAYQISLSIPTTNPLLKNILQDEPAILGSSVSIAYQLQKLIIEPIHSITFETFPHLAELGLLVIDGLDECDDKAQIADFIDVLIKASGQGHLPFRMLLTSRVEEHIRKQFDDSKAHSVYRLDLGKFDSRPDIQVYLEREFHCIYSQNFPIMQRIPQPWPSPYAFSVLLNKAGSSFMFAVTLVQLVRGSKMPHKVLQQILDSKSDGLDPLYKQVLSSASWTTSFHQIIGTIMILEINQSITALSCLLNIQPDEIVQELLEVQSIIKIPGDDNELVLLYHTSLRDFLTIKSRSGEYFINPPLRHIYLDMDCLKCLATDTSGDFFDGGAKRYAYLEWPHHIVLGFQEQEPMLDEAIIGCLVSLIQNLLTFQGRTWYNSILYGTFRDEENMMKWIRAGMDLFQTTWRSTVTKTLFKLFQQGFDFIETEKKNFINWKGSGYGYVYGQYDVGVIIHRRGFSKELILNWRNGRCP